MSLEIWKIRVAVAVDTVQALHARRRIYKRAVDSLALFTPRQLEAVQELAPVLCQMGPRELATIKAFVSSYGK